jgi:hypothetical protein
MADLQGPKIRVGKFEKGRVDLVPGQDFILDAECELGDDKRVGLDYKELPRDVSPGAVLLGARPPVPAAQGAAAGPAVGQVAAAQDPSVTMPDVMGGVTRRQGPPLP